MEENKQQNGTGSESSGGSGSMSNYPLFTGDRIDQEKNRYPHSIVWTPIPCITWLFPIIGHMGICNSAGVIRDFAGPYFVSEDCMAFGDPVKYWQLPLNKIPAENTKDVWDRGVYDASEVYKGRIHNLFCDNCHSHVACALNKMKYDQSASWNMVKLCFLMALHGKYISAGGCVKTWLPFLILMAIILVVVLVVYL